MRVGETDERQVPTGIEGPALTEWASRNLEDLESPLSVERIGDGRSNLTYLLTDASGRDFVLRRPPLGPTLRSAHDMPREYRILGALHAAGLSVPAVRALCEDEDVIGAPFFVMEALRGVVLTTTEDVEALSADARRRSAFSLVDFLVELQEIRPDDVGLGGLARRGGYALRQIDRWSRQLAASRVGADPALGDVERLLRAALPEDRPDRVVHGDFKLENVILGDDGSIVGVLDWELCTLGHPVADLATLLTYWTEAGDDPAHGISGRSTPSRAPGFPSRRELVDRFRERGGSTAGLAFFEALAAWRLAIILQGVIDRFQATPENANTDVESLQAAKRSFTSEAMRTAGGLR